MLGLSSEMIQVGNCSFTDIKFAKKLILCVCVDVMTEVLFLQDAKNTDLIHALGINKNQSAIISSSQTLPHLLFLFDMFCLTSRNCNAIRAVRAAAPEQHPPSRGRSLPARGQAGPGNLHCDCIAAGPNQPGPDAQEYPSLGMLLQPGDSLSTLCSIERSNYPHLNQESGDEEQWWSHGKQHCCEFSLSRAV